MTNTDTLAENSINPFEGSVHSDTMGLPEFFEFILRNDDETHDEVAPPQTTKSLFDRDGFRVLEISPTDPIYDFTTTVAVQFGDGELLGLPLRDGATTTIISNVTFVEELVVIRGLDDSPEIGTRGPDELEEPPTNDFTNQVGYDN